MKECLLKFYNDLSTFSDQYPIVVTYDYSSNTFTYRQLNKIVIGNQITHLYKSKKFSMGILTNSGYLELMNNLLKLIKDEDWSSGKITASIEILSTDFYKLYKSPHLSGPQKLLTLNYVTIKSKLWIWILSKLYPNEVKILLKLIRNERISNRGQSNKSE